MNKEEFETYLISIGGLVRTYRDYKGPIVDAKFCQCHEGWYGIIKNVIEELIALGWNKRINQIKEKFGGLRFYAEDLPEGGNDVIIKYERLSSTICEMCGQSGVPREGKWIRTLCEEHSQGNKPFDAGRFNNLFNINQ